MWASKDEWRSREWIETPSTLPPLRVSCCWYLNYLMLQKRIYPCFFLPHWFNQVLNLLSRVPSQPPSPTCSSSLWLFISLASAGSCWSLSSSSACYIMWLRLGPSSPQLPLGMRIPVSTCRLRGLGSSFPLAPPLSSVAPGPPRSCWSTSQCLFSS